MAPILARSASDVNTVLPRRLTVGARPAVVPALSALEGVIAVPLDDDDPRWDLHSGGDGHTGPEWGEGDRARAAAFYASLSGNAR